MQKYYIVVMLVPSLTAYASQAPQVILAAPTLTIKIAELNEPLLNIETYTEMAPIPGLQAQAVTTTISLNKNQPSHSAAKKCYTRFCKKLENVDMCVVSGCCILSGMMSFAFYLIAQKG